MTADDLVTLLHDAHVRQDEMLRARYQRSLPFADGLFDRWERAKRLGFGEGASIYNSALVFGDVTVAAHTWIGPSVILDGSGGGLAIGDHCSVSGGVHIYTHDTVLWSLSGGELGRRTGVVTIGRCCYIGSQSVIAPNVTVGDRCVIAANSLVRRDVPDGTIVAGSPATVIGRVKGQGRDVSLVWNARGPVT